MKQHITTEQLFELHAGPRVALRYSLTRGEKWQKYIWDDIAKMLTIGKMIEIVNEHHSIFLMQYVEDDWNILIAFKENNVFEWKFDETRKELADALWEALKYVLGGEEDN